jgi:hypothetical protein
MHNGVVCAVIHKFVKDRTPTYPSNGGSIARIGEFVNRVYWEFSPKELTRGENFY